MRRISLKSTPWLRHILDICLTWSALFLADLFRRSIPAGRDLAPGTVYLTPAIYLIVGVVWSVSFIFFDVHRTNRRRALDEIRTVISAVAVAALLFIGSIYLTRTRDFSRLLVAYFVILDLGFLLCTRWLYRIGSVLTQRASDDAQRTVIVGAGPTAQEVARRIETHPYAGFQVIGYVSTDHEDELAFDGQYPRLGHLDNLRQIIGESQAGCTILALPITKANQTTPAILRLMGLPTRV